MNKARVTLVAIAVLFLAPLVLALLMRSEWWGFKPSHLSNRGTLVKTGTVLPLAATRAAGQGAAQESLHKRWKIVYWVPAPCNADCRGALASLRQVHIASGRDRERVVIWLLHGETPAAAEEQRLFSIYAEFKIHADPDGVTQGLLASLEGTGGKRFGDAPGQAFLLDPANHIILRYAPGFDPRDLSQDLDRLLTWTQEQ